MNEITYFTIGLLIGLVFLVMTYVSRAGMYIPRPWHQFMPYSILLASLYLEDKLKSSAGIFFMQIGALLAWAYQVVAGIMYQAYLTGWGKAKDPQPAPEPADPTLGPGFIPTKRAIMQPMTQTVEAPKINAEQKVARMLISQRNQNMKIDLTEEFWIKRGNFDGSPEEFRSLKARWVRQGVSYKTGTRKNAPHDVKDWRKVRLIADGHQLPGT